MRIQPILTGALAMAAAAALPAQTRRAEPVEAPRARVFAIGGEAFDRNRPIIGISTSTGSNRDTLGVLVASVTPGSPAEKAGIQEGDRIAAVNGVNLRLDRADLEDREMAGLMSRRLTREVGKGKPGDEVELRVHSGGQLKTLRVKTVAAGDLDADRERVRTVARSADRAALGLSLASTGSRRDTLGLLVMRVSPDGPAEKAGIFEGSRLASINGVDLRVPREDAGDSYVGSARASRFRRELEKVTAGQDVELRVYVDGQFRTVRVKAARASELRDDGARIFIGDGAEFLPALPRIMTSPELRGRVYQMEPGTWDLDLNGRVDLRLDEARLREIHERARDAAERAVDAARRAIEEVRAKGVVQIRRTT